MSILTYVFVWVFVMHIFLRMTIHILMYFRHVHVCTNDYPYFYGFLSCTCLYEWLSIFLCMGFHYAHFCTNDYPFLSNGFSSCTFMYEWLPFRCIWAFVMHILCKWLSIFFWFFRVCNSLQRVNSMVQWRIINNIIIYIGFYHVCNSLQRVNSMVQWRIIKDIIMYISF